mgnify:CR=1 FL=1
MRSTVLAALATALTGLAATLLAAAPAHAAPSLAPSLAPSFAALSPPPGPDRSTLTAFETGFKEGQDLLDQGQPAAARDDQRHARPLAVGLNCALGAALMRPYIQELNRVAEDTFISCYPNAGLPNPMSDTGFDETPDVTSRLIREFAAEGLVNIVGGCCGTTPAHIAAIAQQVGRYRPRPNALFSELLAEA